MNTELTLRITNIGSRGEGVASCDGIRYFVPKTAAGDLARVRPTTKLRGSWVCELLEVIEESPQRRKPECMHFEICGGCDLQHLNYRDQLDWKISTARHWIGRSALAPYVDTDKIEITASPKEFGYRHRALFHFKNSKPGYYLKRSRTHFEIEDCPVLRPGFLGEVSKLEPEDGDLQLMFLHDQLRSESSISFDGSELHFSSQHFSQPNLFVNELMQTRLDQWLSRRPGGKAVDLYCGMGNFTAVLDKHFEHIVGVESEELSIGFAKNNLPHIEWIQTEAESLPAEFFENRDFLLLDPSRQGALEVCRKIGKSSIPTVAYISCQLDTLIRDLVSLVKKSGYEILEWQLFDLLPQTRHIESMVFLQKPSRQN